MVRLAVELCFSKHAPFYPRSQDLGFGSASALTGSVTMGQDFFSFGLS